MDRRFRRLLAVLALLWAIAAGGAHAASLSESWHRLANDPYGGLVGPAVTVGPDQHIYIIFGYKLQRFDPQAHTWAALSNQLTGDHPGLIAVGDQLYAVGGQQFQRFEQSFNEVYSLRTGTWRYVARSHWPHAGSGVALGRDGRIYVGGGFVGAPGNGLEGYDPHADRWTKLANMPRDVFAPGVAADATGQIFFIGGTTYDPQFRPMAIHDVQVYEPKSNRWTTAAPMPTARMALAAVTAQDGKIYAIGGSLDPSNNGEYVRGHVVGTVEVYDPKTNHWNSGPHLSVPRAALAAVLSPNGVIYAIGGFGIGIKATGTVEALTIAPAGRHT